MEINNNLDAFLKKQMSIDEMESPPNDLVKNARLKVLARKTVAFEKQDLFYKVANFLNLRVKLSYAVVVLVFISFGSVYFIKDTRDYDSTASSPDVVNIPSARSSTVLSSIITFETRR